MKYIYPPSPNVSHVCDCASHRSPLFRVQVSLAQSRTNIPQLSIFYVTSFLVHKALFRLSHDGILTPPRSILIVFRLRLLLLSQPQYETIYSLHSCLTIYRCTRLLMSGVLGGACLCCSRQMSIPMYTITMSTFSTASRIRTRKPMLFSSAGSTFLRRE